VPITLISGPANAGKAELVMDAVRRHLAHGEEPLLVVPTRTDTAYYLRELAGAEAVMGVRVTVFADLLEELVRRAAVAQRVLGSLATERLIGTLRAASSERSPAGASSERSHAGVRRALGDLFAELQIKRVTPQRLAAALDAGLGDARAALGLDLAGAYGEYLRRLARLDRLDETQRALQALDRLRERPSLWGATPVLFYGFDDLAPLQLDAIETLGRVVDAPVTVSLVYERGRTAFAGRAGTFETLAPLAHEHRSLPPRSEHYAERSRSALAHLERNLFETGAPRVDPAGAIALLQGGGERAELELIARRVAALLAGGMPAEEVAVLVRRPAGSAALVGEIFTAAGIPFAMPLVRSFADTALGRALIGLLRCVPAADGRAPGRPADLLAWLRAPGRLERPELADALERDVRRRGFRSVEQARARWEERWFALDTIDRLADAQRRGPAALAEYAGRELLRLFTAPRRGRASVLEGEEVDEARALAAGRAALSELGELARLAPDAAPAGAGELAAALAGVEVNSGELPGRGSVAVLDPLALRARRVRVLFLSGLQEGVFPLRARPQPLLGERERGLVARASGLVLGESEDVLAAERYLLYAVLSRPEEQLVLSWHETDDEAAPLSRSLFVEDVCDLFDERLYEQRERRPLGSVELAQEGGALRGAELVAGGHLTDERVLRELRERVWSATSIERWMACPVSWFVERLLAPSRLDPDPEPFARGRLAHEALNATFEQLGLQTGSARVTRASLELARELLRAALAEAEARHPLSVIPERALVARRALGADLERYLEHAAELEGPLAPRYFELAFGPFEEGEPNESPSALPPLDLGGGLRLRGRIDRIDVGDGGEAVVVDYKGGEAPRGQRWLKDGKVQVALYMQAAEQLLGLNVVGGLYQPLRGEKIQARGAILAGHESAAECARTDRYEPEALEELLASAREAAREAAGQAGRGELEARPASCAWRGGCMFPTICRCER
jgi:ATP-dependent helicase/DNAse subunit B